MKSIGLVILLIICGCSSTEQSVYTSEPEKEYVVLLHGMGRTDRSMLRVQMHLEEEGYNVVNISYASTADTIQEIVEKLKKEIPARCDDASKRVNFVTHSLGGILVRAYLAEGPKINLGRVVMLAPPNRGSEIVDTFKDIGFYRHITGPAGQALGTSADSVPRTMGRADFEVGIIAGDRSFNPLYSSLVKGKDDGKVSVENAKLDGMKDFLVVHSSHTFIMQRKYVIDQIILFLKRGHFDHGADEK